MNVVEIPDVLLGLDARFLTAAKAEFPTLGQKIKTKWKQNESSLAKNPTGRYENSIDISELNLGTDVLKLVVDTSKNPEVTYSDVFERGRRDRPAYYGRFPAKLTVENIGQDVRDFVEKAIDGAFR